MMSSGQEDFVAMSNGTCFLHGSSMMETQNIKRAFNFYMLALRCRSQYQTEG